LLTSAGNITNAVGRSSNQSGPFTPTAPARTPFQAAFRQSWALEDTRSVPGSKKLVCVAAGHHTLAVGPVVVIDPSQGINNPNGISIVTPDVKPTEGGMDGVPAIEGGVRDGGGLYSTPWALSEKYFLASYTYANKETDASGYGLYLIDVFGNKELVYRDPAISSFIPMPLRPRQRPPIIPEAIDLAKNRRDVRDQRRQLRLRRTGRAHRLCANRRANRLALRQHPWRTALRGKRTASHQLDADSNPRRRAGRARRQRALSRAGGYRRLFSIA